jgi:hypothetical protein
VTHGAEARLARGVATNHRDGPLRRNRALKGKRLVATGFAVALVSAVACQERSPTALDDTQLPDAPLSVQVELPWSDFGSNFEVLGGYSSASSLPQAVVAHLYDGALESRMLLRFGQFPLSAVVNNSEGVPVPDDSITYVAGTVVLYIDTLNSVYDGPVSLRLSTLEEEWDARSATWTAAVDSLNDQRLWSEPGAGPATLATNVLWDPTVSDSVLLFMDSVSIAEWADVSDRTRGGRVEATTDGVFLRVNRARLLVRSRASINPDTLAEDTVRWLDRTFVYDPTPTVPVGVRVGGVPAWRSMMQVTIPPLNGPPELCAAVSCPFTPEGGQISYAGLELVSRATEAGFEPFDSLSVDVRSVLSPPRLPKSPLGPSETGGLGTAVSPEAFGVLAGSPVDVPVTSFIRTLLEGPDSDGRAPPSTLALLSASEPASLSFASFYGPGDPQEPVLRLVITVGDDQVRP